MDTQIKSGTFKMLAGTLYNQLVETRALDSSKFKLRDLATMPFSNLVQTVLTDEKTFTEMQEHLNEHIKSANIIGYLRPALKYGLEATGAYFGGVGTNIATFLTFVSSNLLDKYFESADPITRQSFEVGEYLAIDAVGSKNPDNPKRKDQFTIGFYVDEDRTNPKNIYAFIYEQSQVMTVQIKHCRRLVESEKIKLTNNKQLEFIKDIFLLRYYDPLGMQVEPKIDVGTEYIFDKKRVYLIDENTSGRSIVQDNDGKQFKVDKSQLQKGRSTQCFGYSQGEWVIIPSVISSKFPIVLGVVYYFVGNDAYVYDCTTGTLAGYNRFDLEKPSQKVLKLISGNYYFTRFRKMATEGRKGLKKFRIPEKYYHLAFLQGLDAFQKSPEMPTKNSVQNPTRYDLNQKIYV